uniref:Putative secreted protein n=1 Tax=Anopheles darlingi TaxID=43151 RepID=A0A2M4D2W2_ANODA
MSILFYYEFLLLLFHLKSSLFYCSVNNVLLCGDMRKVSVVRFSFARMRIISSAFRLEPAACSLSLSLSLSLGFFRLSFSHSISFSTVAMEEV